MLAVGRISASFKASFGDIVFGMEDGTVSIFGLVFGVAASTSDSRVVLVAGMTGAIAAAVSMMAGAYLDAETARDQARAARVRAAVDDPTLFASEPMRDRLLSRRPDARRGRRARRRRARLSRNCRVRCGPRSTPKDARRRRVRSAHALWMFVVRPRRRAGAGVPVRAAADRAGALRLDRVHGGRARRPRHRPRAVSARRRLLPTTLQTLGIAAVRPASGRRAGRQTSFAS